MMLATGAASATADDHRQRSSEPAEFACVHYAHTMQRPALLLATHHAVSALDALAWLITRSCDIAEQLDAEPRRQVRHRMLAATLQEELLRDLRERCPVTIEIADPETRFELTVRTCAETA
ncbi:hypothetical protein ABZT51_31910 [Streptomyces sp. NPDC005373]|jgi:hypothetical protein|uniref:hypothetical protein n=1 Tax=Streptomyces sp. NPDC005373 TaxID=3156879 RepID=UPI0033BD9519